MMRITLEHFVRTISELLGWLYFLCWSGSFYPQPLLNHRRRSTAGVSLDFSTINVLGFVCYTISTASFLFSPAIRAQYAARNPSAPEPAVRLNDFAYCLHAVLLSSLTYSMFFPRLWGFDRTVKQRSSTPIRGVWWGSLVGVAGSSILVLVARARAGGGILDNDGPTSFLNSHPERWDWIDVAYACGYVKLVITIIKYTPQAYINFQRKSTVAFSILQIQLDLLGGLFSNVQLILDSSLQGDWTGVTGNPVKFGLGNVTILFDIVFMVQHYWLYRGNDATSPSPLAGVDVDVDPILGRKSMDDFEEENGERRPLLSHANSRNSAPAHSGSGHGPAVRDEARRRATVEEVV
ncbi:hypothetical protein L228DRAFT_243781 [Xylona heveae TC161]|uniref:Cystinosin n=1 Tax=Xylona heveae (strain CBS 132557 / TC161) TaxID=1328760 RepID=A0A165IK14_XYLHT|nr:hypothetical protein L228DRAFT_243781 [Xylona heveae TC161]KZF25003.1 hypothetical protein L228DRAFT_243781 [Xylona heveae TC161]